MRFKGILNARTQKLCFEHPLAKDEHGATFGSIALNMVYTTPFTTAITDDAKLICEAVLSDVLEYA